MRPALVDSAAPPGKFPEAEAALPAYCRAVAREIRKHGHYQGQPGQAFFERDADGKAIRRKSVCLLVSSAWQDRTKTRPAYGQIHGMYDVLATALIGPEYQGLANAGPTLSSYSDTVDTEALLEQLDAIGASGK